MTAPIVASRPYFRQLISHRTLGVAICLLLTFGAMAALNPAFVDDANVTDMLAGCSATAIIACGVGMVVLTGEIDISVGSLYGLLAGLFGLLTSPTHAALPPWIAAGIVLVAGTGVGLINGLLVTLGRVPSIIATLGMMTALRGITELALGGQWITDIPPSIRNLATTEYFGMAFAVYVAVFVTLCSLWLLGQTPLGLHMYAIGSDPEAARLAGLNVSRVRVSAFAFTGLLVGVAVLVTVPRLPVIESGLGTGLELLVVTAVVVGGVSIRGGSGSLAGVALAVILLSMVRTCLVFLQLGPTAAYWERAIQGLFILGAVVVDSVPRRSSVWTSSSHHAPHQLTWKRMGGLNWVPLFLSLFAWMAFAGFSRPDFLAFEIQRSLLTQSAEVGLLVLPTMLIFLMGGIDLSVGSTMALAAVTAGLAHECGFAIWFSALLAVLVGTLGGFINGVFVVVGRIHPLIVTLATLSLYRGVAEGLSGGRPISGFPDSFIELGSDHWFGMPLVLVPAVLAFVATGVLLRYGVAGRNIRAIGFNETACRFCGMAVNRLKISLYTLSGTAAGLAAVLLVARRNTAKADAGMGMELEVIAAVVLGGTSVSGGRGSLLGTLMGFLLLHEVRQFLAWRWSNEEYILIVVGLLLITSVLSVRLLRSELD